MIKPKHRCPDWDFMEIDSSNPEIECCNCDFDSEDKMTKTNEERDFLIDEIETVIADFKHAKRCALEQFEVFISNEYIELYTIIINRLSAIIKKIKQESK